MKINVVMKTGSSKKKCYTYLLQIALIDHSFFSYLVEELLNVKTVILFYPNHAMVVVNVTDESMGVYT